MRIGLLFGSFNPVHIGHLIIANSMIDYANLDQTWLVITPQSPFKINDDILDQEKRLEMIQLSIADNPKLKASNVEFAMPKPNYTAFTLQKLQSENIDKTFVLIMGEDNLQQLHKWKNFEYILENFEIYVYPRPNTETSILKSHPKVTIVNTPLLDISSTFIRESVSKGYSAKYKVHDRIIDLIAGFN